MSAETDTLHLYIIFQDDFETGDAGDWTINIPPEAPQGSSVTVETDDGNQVLCSRGQTWAEAGGYYWTNYTLEVKVKMLSIEGGGHISVHKSGPSRYLAQFWGNGLAITKEHEETFTQLTTVKTFFQTNRWYSFRIVCIGSTIQVYVDDALKLTYTDESDPILMGPIVLESGPGSVIYYDDVTVSTTLRLYAEHLIQEARDEINQAKTLGAETGEAEQRLDDAQAAYSGGDLSAAASLAEEAIGIASHAPVGAVSVDTLLRYESEYDQRTVEVSGTIRDIRFEEGSYVFALDDGTGVIPGSYNRTLGEIKTDDQVKALGRFDAQTNTLIVESIETQTEDEYFTFLIFKDDFEDGDFSDWMTDVDPGIEGSGWTVETEGGNQFLCCEGSSWGWAGDTEWTDYTIESKLRLIEGGCGIGFRISHKPEGAEHYTLSFTRYRLALVKAELYLNEVRPTEIKHVSVDLDPDRWYDVKIVCIGNNVEAYIDGALKIGFADEDNPFLEGAIEIGVFPHDGDKPSNALFDDVKVSRIATTSDINDLITYAQSEIDAAKEINADVTSAELKLEQARRALAQENYETVQYLVDEAVWLAKRASLGEISIKDLRAIATRCSGHLVTITGTVKNLEDRYGAGYEFALNDGTGEVAVTYQGALLDIADDYEVKVTGLFDAARETVSGSKIEKVSVPSTAGPSIPTGLLGVSLSIEQMATLLSIGGAVAGVCGWFVRHERMEKRRKVLFTKLMDEVDAVYSRFKMNAVQCEAELYKLKDEVLDEFKEGTIDENKHSILEQRIEEHLHEVRKQIEREKS
jgi:hypothetical protein